jgi:hypothetical protein
MKMPIIATQPALALVLLYAAAPMVHAQDEQVAVEARPPIQFMSGGIGQTEEAAMRKAAKDFNLRLEFSERKDNEFVADADLRITDMQGRPVFVLLDADPMVNVNLPDGRYRVAASLHGQTETRLVNLRGKEGENLYFHWNGNAKNDPNATAEGS